MSGDGTAGGGPTGGGWASAVLKGLKAFDLPVAYAAAAGRIISCLATGSDPGERHLGDGWGTKVGLERWARAYCEANPRADLGVMFGLVTVATMTCAQGALVLKAPIAGGGWLDVPAVAHFMAEADSGWRKSTALAAVKQPLDRALAAGVTARREGAITGAQGVLAAAADAGIGVGDKEVTAALRKQVGEVFAAGICPLTYIKDPTVEALRNLAVDNGGCAAVLAGEADVFRNLTAYGGDAGALTFFLDLWDQDSIETARVSGGVKFMRSVALNLAVLFQTEVFAEVTSGDRAVRGADSFVSRGMFGRAWVVEAYSGGGHEGTAGTYADDAAALHYAAGDEDGLVGAAGEVSELAGAQLDLESAWRDLVVETSDYRAVKSRLRAWDAGAAKAGADWLVPRAACFGGSGVAADGTGDAARRGLFLSDDAQLAYRRVQRLQAAVEAAVESADPDVRFSWSPLAARIVQHVLRDALAATLASGSRVITGAAIEDAAVRVLPWRWGMTTAALGKRGDEIGEDTLHSTLATNPKLVTREPRDVLMAVLVKMAKADPGLRAYGFGREEVIRKAVSSVARSVRRGLSTLLRKELDLMAADPKCPVSANAVGVDAVGRTVYSYVISALAVEGST